MPARIRRCRAMPSAVSSTAGSALGSPLGSASSDRVTSRATSSSSSVARTGSAPIFSPPVIRCTSASWGMTGPAVVSTFRATHDRNDVRTSASSVSSTAFVALAASPIAWPVSAGGLVIGILLIVRIVSVEQGLQLASLGDVLDPQLAGVDVDVDGERAAGARCHQIAAEAHPAVGGACVDRDVTEVHLGVDQD